MLRFTALLLVAASASAQALVADFDAAKEGTGGTSLTDGGITFSNLVPNLSGAVGEFFIERSGINGVGFPGFTGRNVLSFGAYNPGPPTVFGNCNQFDIIPPSRARAATIQVAEFGNDPAVNKCALEAFSNGVLVASSSFKFVGGGIFTVTPHTLSISGTPFDRLRLRCFGRNNNGTSFIVVDSVVIELDAAPGAGSALNTGGRVVISENGSSSQAQALYVGIWRLWLQHRLSMAFWSRYAAKQ